MNVSKMLVVDFMHEFELGVWKTLFRHMICVLCVAFVRVVMPNLLFCIHQWDSEGIGGCEWECRRLSRSKRMIGRVVRRDREEEVSNESI